MSILEVKNLCTYFDTPHGVVKAVDDISFGIEKGEVFGIVGESGSGKTMTALSILKLISPPARILGGKVLFNGTNLLEMDERSLRQIRGSKISMVFQEPASSFNPVFTIGTQIAEAVLAHQDADTNRAAKIALEYLSRVHIGDPRRVFYDYPHQLSGGIKQRAMIAMALVNQPQIVILDEPTTALDVTIQAQVLDLLDEIIHEEALSILFISHDFGVIARMCGRVAVMRSGKIVESGKTHDILDKPKDPYTISLLESVKALS